MKKREAIDYLNRIRPYLNLKAVCEDYNQKGYMPIDYNNLRAVINGVSKTRLSEERILCFIAYLFNDLYIDTFCMNPKDSALIEDSISNVILSYANEMSTAIIKEIKDGLHSQ